MNFVAFTKLDQSVVEVFQVKVQIVMYQIGVI